MKFYKKMLTTFVTVSIIYTFIIEAFFLVGYYAFTMYSFDKNAEAAAVSAAEYTDLRIQSVRQMYQLVRFNSDTSKYCSETPDIPNRYARLKLHEFIKKLYNSASVEIQRLAVSRLIDDYVMLDNSTGDLKFFMSEFYITADDIDQIMSSYESNINLPYLLLVTKSNEYVVVMCDTVSYTSKLYFFAKFSVSGLISGNMSDNAEVALTHNGEVIAGSLGAEDISAAFADKDFYTKRIALSIYGTNYLYMVPKPQILFSATAILILLCGIAAAGISIAIMLKITKNMYDPIKRLVKTVGDTQLSEDEISFIHSKYRAMKEQMDSLSTSLYKYSDNLNKKLLRDLLIGIMPPDEAKDHFTNMHFLTDSGLYTSVLIKLMDATGVEDTACWDKFGIIKELLLPLLSGNADMHSLIEVSADTLGLIFTGMSTDAISNVMKNLVSTIEPDDDFEICAAVGPPCDKIESIYESYKIANRILLQADTGLYRHRVLTPDYINQTESSYRSLYYPLNIEQSLMNGVLGNKEKQWRSALEELIDGNRNLSDYSHLSLMLSTTASRIADSVNRKLCEFFTDGFIAYLEFRACHGIEEIRAKADEMFCTIANGIGLLRNLSSESLGDKMKGFVIENYNKNISLYDLADYMNMTRNYVSAVFKNATGVNFKDFISELRFTAACDIIIKDPTVRLMDVAERVGCNSLSLGRLFMRYYGGAPSDYQRQVLQNSDDAE